MTHEQMLPVYNLPNTESVRILYSALAFGSLTENVLTTSPPLLTR